MIQVTIVPLVLFKRVMNPAPPWWGDREDPVFNAEGAPAGHSLPNAEQRGFSSLAGTLNMTGIRLALRRVSSRH